MRSICTHTHRWSWRPPVKISDHTIISHSDIKRIVTAPPGYLLTYFDISSAEVRSIAYKSGDPTMINLFESGQDLYVHIGKIAFPDLDWTTKAVKKAKRPIFKQV